MVTINYNNLADLILKHWKNIALVVMAYFLFNQCSGNSELKLANSVLKNQSEKHLKAATEFEQKNVYLQDDLARLEDTIQKLKTNEQKLISERKTIAQKTKIKIEKIKKYNSSQIAQYIQDRYNVDSTQVQTTDIGTAIKDETAKDILTELEQGDGCELEIVKVEKLYLNEKEISKQKDSIIENITEQKDNLSQANIEYKSANELTKNALDNTEKMFKKEKNKKNIWKLTTFATIVGSIFLISK
jgi:hypothetical protein